MKLSHHDKALEAATIEHQRVHELHSEAANLLSQLEAKFSGSAMHNSRLIEARAIAELDGEEPPEAELIDTQQLRAQIEEQVRRAQVFQKGRIEASRALQEARTARDKAYRAAYRGYAETLLPSPAVSLRQERPSLSDFGDVTLGQVWQAYLLHHAGGVSFHPRDFGEFSGKLFALPDPAEAWPDLRDTAVLWAEDQTDTDEAA